jgi:protoheme IX farnesyltransferase
MPPAADLTKGVSAPFALSGVSSPRDWFLLLKPRVMLLVVYTGAIGLWLAPSPMHPVLAFAAILSIAVGGGAAGALNMWYERDIDARMERTRRRPIPAGRIEPDDALGFGIVLAAASVLVMGLAANWFAALLLAGSILFYVLVYTAYLKPRTAQNIVIGGAAGAFPPAIGWAAATGDLSLYPVILFAIILLWTPPHFWALSLWTHADYARAGVPMLPVVAGARATRRQIFAYTVLLFLAALLPWALGFAGWPYGLAALLLGAEFLRHGVMVLREKQDPTGISLVRDHAAKRAFAYSIAYLFLLFGALAGDHALSLAGLV